MLGSIYYRLALSLFSLLSLSLFSLLSLSLSLSLSRSLFSLLSSLFSLLSSLFSLSLSRSLSSLSLFSLYLSLSLLSISLSLSLSPSPPPRSTYSLTCGLIISVIDKFDGLEYINFVYQDTFLRTTFHSVQPPQSQASNYIHSAKGTKFSYLHMSNLPNKLELNHWKWFLAKDSFMGEDDDIPQLPHEVWWIIFSFLKLESRTIASTVCSGWR